MTTIEDLKVNDEIEWEDCNGELYEGTVTEINEDDGEAYVNFFKGHFVDHAEVSLGNITKINGVSL